MISRAQKDAANQSVAQAIKRRILKRASKCQDCGEKRKNETLHGHHEDYSKPLEVIWLCVTCHRRRHRNRSAGGYDIKTFKLLLPIDLWKRLKYHALDREVRMQAMILGTLEREFPDIPESTKRSIEMHRHPEGIVNSDDGQDLSVPTEAQI